MNKIAKYAFVVLAAVLILAYRAIASGESDFVSISMAILFDWTGMLCLLALLPCPVLFVRNLLKNRDTILLLVYGLATIVLVPLLWQFFLGLLIAVAFMPPL